MNGHAPGIVEPPELSAEVQTALKARGLDFVPVRCIPVINCGYEVPGPILLSLRGRVYAYFCEEGGVSPANILRCDQASRVIVVIDFSGSELARLLCVRWCVKVVFEPCGPGQHISLPHQWVEEKLCENRVVVVSFLVPGRTFPCDGAPGYECGSLWNVCITVTSFDMCKKPAPFAGYCTGGPIMVYPAP